MLTKLCFYCLWLLYAEGTPDSEMLTWYKDDCLELPLQFQLCALPIHFVRGWGRNAYNPKIAKGSFGIWNLTFIFPLSESAPWICSSTRDPHTHLPSREMQQHSRSVLLGYTEGFALHSAPQTWKKHGRGRAGRTRPGCGVKRPNRALSAELTQLPLQHQRVPSPPGAFPALWNHTDSGSVVGKKINNSSAETKSGKTLGPQKWLFP